MAEIPLLMNGFSIKATLDNLKTQTRRPMRVQPVGGVRLSPFVRSGYEDKHGRELRCPFGVLGDLLYARETFAVRYTPNQGPPWDSWTDEQVLYRASGDESSRWYPSIHMPKKHARLWLVNTGVRVERVQDITIDDAMEEGIGEVESAWVGLRNPPHPSDWITAYGRVWDSIYSAPKPVCRKGKVVGYVSYPWDEIREMREHRGKPWEVVGNPWLWALKYRKVVHDGRI